jgi:hypothetical protein
MPTMRKKARFSAKIADMPRSWQSLLTRVEAGERIGLVPQCVQHLRANDLFSASERWLSSRRHFPMAPQ